MAKQSTVIFASLILMFLVFITVTGDLPSWLALFTKKNAAPSASGASTSDKVASAAKTGAEIAQTAAQVAAYFGG